MTNNNPPNTDWVQLQIFDLKRFHKDKPLKKKQCKTCRKSKSIELFSPKTGTKGGISTVCKECDAARQRERTRQIREGVYQRKLPQRPPIKEGFRLCCKCKQEFPLTNFHKTTKGNRAYCCKKCSVPKAKEKLEKAKIKRENRLPSCFAYKECSKCKKWLEVKYFSLSPSSEDGYVSGCKKCRQKAIQVYRKNNLPKYAMWAMDRYTLQCSSIASWSNEAEILLIYEEAERLTKKTGIKYAVDHIHPLKGKLIAGLTVESNLRVITAIENSRKNNRFTPYVWSELTPEQQKDPLYNPFWREEAAKET